MELMCKCQRQEQQVADLRKLVEEIAKLESGAPDAPGGDNSGGGNWETQSVCSDVSGVSRSGRLYADRVFFLPSPSVCFLCAAGESGRASSLLFLLCGAPVPEDWKVCVCTAESDFWSRYTSMSPSVLIQH